MKSKWSIWTSFLCAALFLANACMYGIVLGLNRDSGYYVCLGLAWLVGAVIWIVRGVHKWKENNND